MSSGKQSSEKNPQSPLTGQDIENEPTVVPPKTRPSSVTDEPTHLLGPLQPTAAQPTPSGADAPQQATPPTPPAPSSPAPAQHQAPTRLTTIRSAGPQQATPPPQAQPPIQSQQQSAQPGSQQGSQRQFGGQGMAGVPDLARTTAALPAPPTPPGGGYTGLNDETIPGAFTPAAGVTPPGGQYLPSDQYLRMPAPPPAVVRAPVPTIPNTPPLGTKRGGARQGRAGPRSRWRLALMIVLIALLLTAAVGAIDAGVRAWRAHAEAADGLQHIRNIEALIPSSKANIGSSLTPATVTRIQSELTAAEHDFANLRSDLGAPQGTFWLAAHTPGVDTSFNSAAALAAAADEACLAGLDLARSGQTILGILKGGFFSDSKSSSGLPTLNMTTFTALKINFGDAVAHLTLAVEYAQTADLSSIPSQLLKPSLAAQLQKLLKDWPKEQQQLAQAGQWLDVAPGLIGLTTPAHYLIELMDRTELRAAGGFIGNYGVVTVQNAKAKPFSLSDTYLLDVPWSQGAGKYSRAPSVYPWWPFGSFGLRDSNLSPDFPTSAQLGEQLYQEESGQNISFQGVVAVTPVAIGRVLDVIGPVKVPGFNVTVNAQNLQSTIHYYQLGGGSVDSSTNLPPSDQISSPRKRFTALLGKAFLAKLHGLGSKTLALIAKEMLTSLHAKDLEIYLTDPNAEALLAQDGLAATMAQGPGDGVTIVDTNVGGNKANLFTHISYTDTVTLDDQGNATHHLTLTYSYVITDFSQLYAAPQHSRFLDYIRIYTPPNAQLASSDGLTNFRNDDQLSGASDLSGRTMWGGFIALNDHDVRVLHFTWTVSHIATKDASGKWVYTLTYQKQAGADQRLTLTITAPGAAAVSYNAGLDTDKVFRVVYS